MSGLKRLWLRYLNSGSRHFPAASDRKFNRVLNLLFAINLLAGALLVLAEVVIFAILLRRDYPRYINYIPAFALLNIAHPIVTFATLWLKNRTGSFRATYFSNLAYTIYILLLCLYLGERAHIHVILFMIIPTSFIIYRYGRWLDLAIHSAIMVGGLVAALLSYEFVQPWFPMPPDILRAAGYLSWAAAIGLIYAYSIDNWREVYDAEKLLADEKDRSQGLLKETIPKLQVAEAKYRRLVDDSEDLIFQASTDGVILSMNKTVQKMLSLKPEEMPGKSLYEFIAEAGSATPEFHRELLRERIKELLVARKTLRMHTWFHHKYRPDGVEVILTLQLINSDTGQELMGRASLVEPEVSLRFLDHENGRYTLANDVMHAEILGQRIAQRTALFFESKDLNPIRTCLREMLVNAIEHGNLEVTFDEKTAAIETGDYLDFLQTRKNDPRYAGRRVRVHYVINRRVMICRIIDDGKGFDHGAFISRSSSDDGMLSLEHGRGIMMARNAFDEVSYNQKGNEVTLRKNITRRPHR